MTTARTIQAIRTLYNGIQYRSRLEARWSAMFDLLKWPHGERDEPEWVPPAPAQAFACLRCEQVSFHSESGGFHCSSCGASERHRASAGDVASLWTAAGNLVQWKGAS